MKQLKTSSTEWQTMRDDLLERVKVIDNWISRITNGTPSYIMLEGGRVGYKYDLLTKELSIWNKGTRYSSGSLTVNDLGTLQSILEEWQTDCEVNF
ncbi:hypothetical protein CON64_22685 [Bacillus pseudomycoides]|nr:hypothetical protein CON64_22685 [Bacillus pseudomycoides]